jgi:hypothetical protein
MGTKPASQTGPNALDRRLRLLIYDHILDTGRAPLVAQMARRLSRPLRQVQAALRRLCASHAFVLQENGELWRAAPFSAVPTGFTAEAGKRSWWGNCIWDALGILAALHQDGLVRASCGCCNLEMILHVRKGALQEKRGTIHFAVPARLWYDDVVFT